MIYSHTQTTFILDPDNIKNSINKCLLVPLPEFITKLLGNLHSGGEVLPSSSNLKNLCGMTGTRSPSFKAALVFLQNNPGHDYNKILVEHMNQLSVIASEEFLKIATKLQDTKMKLG